VAKKSSLPDFEAALTELEKIVEKWSPANRAWKRRWPRFARHRADPHLPAGLKEAEQRVDKLLVQNGEVRIEPDSKDQD